MTATFLTKENRKRGGGVCQNKILCHLVVSQLPLDFTWITRARPKRRPISALIHGASSLLFWPETKSLPAHSILSSARAAVSLTSVPVWFLLLQRSPNKKEAGTVGEGAHHSHCSRKPQGQRASSTPVALVTWCIQSACSLKAFWWWIRF